LKFIEIFYYFEITFDLIKEEFAMRGA